LDSSAAADDGSSGFSQDARDSAAGVSWTVLGGAESVGELNTSTAADEVWDDSGADGTAAGVAVTEHRSTVSIGILNASATADEGGCSRRRILDTRDTRAGVAGTHERGAVGIGILDTAAPADDLCGCEERSEGG